MHSEMQKIMDNTQKKLSELYAIRFGESPASVSELPLSGSERRYYRLQSAHHGCMGAFNPNMAENMAGFRFTESLKAAGINVPEIYIIDEDNQHYLLQDLGDTTLFALIQQLRMGAEFPDSLVEVYRRILKELPKIQIEGGRMIDYSVCYPRAAFDKQSMMWDLNYFKYYFLKLAGIAFDEQKLEDDFENLTNYLLQADSRHFLYRDFQSRNIMLHDGSAWFIDFQGGRRGALQYDLASLLYDAKADIPQAIRESFLEYYIDELKTYTEVEPETFRTFFYGFVFIRIMQAMGAYGFRGYYEKKEHFLQSIPHALGNLSWLLQNARLPIELPTLLPLLERLTTSEKLLNIGSPVKKLIVSINSFSYKRGIPVDESGNGGGFVFDCRSLHNPGRYDEYKQLTGKDAAVAGFLESGTDVSVFIKNAYHLVKQSIEVYRSRNFTNLMISFGCTGGQHRSVFCAERLAEQVQNDYPELIVNLRHRELSEHLKHRLVT